MPSGCTLVAYADDLALVVKASKKTKIDLHLAPQKTEMVVPIGSRDKSSLRFIVEEVEVASINRLSILDSAVQGLRFEVHVQKTVEKANQILDVLVLLMPNTGDTGSSKGRVLNGIFKSVVTYAAPVWCSLLNTAKYVS
ncbi:uncharacterized protein [Diabrotica undecimpunctata]|uniref:uncharacterized protein n=1 Tax=Diabrotica undecimpunctata TaxID=50387 RepID=UPI003B63B738